MKNRNRVNLSYKMAGKGALHCVLIQLVQEPIDDLNKPFLNSIIP